jgi:hypothetical protein
MCAASHAQGENKVLRLSSRPHNSTQPYRRRTYVRSAQRRRAGVDDRRVSGPEIRTPTEIRKFVVEKKIIDA